MIGASIRYGYGVERRRTDIVYLTPGKNKSGRPGISLTINVSHDVPITSHSLFGHRSRTFIDLALRRMKWIRK